MNLPNKLTIFRIILVPIMIIIPFLGIKGELFGIPITCIIIDLIFIIASITDQLDGHIARSRNQITTFGKFLDPIADKVLVVTAMIILVEMGRLPAWIPSIVVLILAFIDINKYGAIFTEKLTAFSFALNLTTTLIMTISVIATIFSGWEYIKNGKELLKDM